MKEKILQKCKIKTVTPNWIEYLIYAFLAVFVMLMYRYKDGRSLTVWSTVLLDCVFDGKLYDFYDVAHQNIYGAYHLYMGGNYLALIPWAVWNIPIWILQRFCSLRIMDHTWMQIWSQMFLVFLLAVILLYSNKIMTYFGIDQYTKSWSRYLIATSPFVFFSVFVAEQTDLIVIAATVMAVYYLLQNKQLVFFLLMAFSISSKPFFIFSLVAIVLLIEKNIIKIAAKLLCTIIPMILFGLIYKQAPLYQESIRQGSEQRIIQYTVEHGFGAAGGNASFCIVGCIVLYFIAYCIRYDRKEMAAKRYVIYMMFAPMAVYFAFSTCEFYRRVYLLPFLIIMLALNSKFWSINLLLEKIMVVFGLLQSFQMEYNAAFLPCINEHMTKRMGLTQDVSNCKYQSIFHLLEGKLGDYSEIVRTIVVSVFVTVLGLLLIINFPKIARRLSIPQYKTVRAVYWVNMIFLAGIILVVAMCYFNVF